MPRQQANLIQVDRCGLCGIAAFKVDLTSILSACSRYLPPRPIFHEFRGSPTDLQRSPCRSACPNPCPGNTGMHFLETHTFTRLHGPLKHRGTKLQTSSCRTISLRLSRSMWSSRTLGNLGVKLDPLCERFRAFDLCLPRSNLKWLQVRKIPVWDYRNDRDAKSYWESCSCSMLGRSTNLILLDLGPELQRCSRWNTMASDNKS